MLSYTSDIQKKILEEARILENPDLLYSMEVIYSEYQILEAQKK